ncbi:MAG: tetraacyldisaccharide 4'-kinase [Candidatus Omnitrophota bacterium]
MLKLKQGYLTFIEKDKKNVFEALAYALLCFFSGIYGAIVFLRNFLYQRKIIPVFFSRAKVISVGNLSWSGSGKTSLCLWLYNRLSLERKVAILRRGYGEDEGKLLKEKMVISNGMTASGVFSASKRSKLAKQLEGSFDLFILDDGFQHRSLRRDVDIVIMGSRDFRRKQRLIPAYFFREPLSSLSRADILILNYSEEMGDREAVKRAVLKIAPKLRVYFSQYRPKGFVDLAGNRFKIDFLANRRLGAFAAIGYPQGFFNKLKELNFNLSQRIVYPDHHELSFSEFGKLEDSLIKNSINDLVITHKDKYHLPCLESRLNIFILEVDLEIEDEAGFMAAVEKKLARGVD